jgi:hypothetical protein
MRGGRPLGSRDRWALKCSRGMDGHPHAATPLLGWTWLQCSKAMEDVKSVAEECAPTTLLQFISALLPVIYNSASINL